MRFRRIAETEVDATRVTLKLLKADDGSIAGRVTTLAYNEAGVPELMSTTAADPPVEQAIELATHLAEYKEQDIDVIDDQNLWTADLGELD